jgi:hypothetical protein
MGPFRRGGDVLGNTELTPFLNFHESRDGSRFAGRIDTGRRSIGL